ncbi:RNA polymerase II-associated protein 3 [Episyrphus balteatus]|uniref:RNA polymerase II-associated protein 3 n=1 Tax=Episyrphus balteatus TaxID=286459 RepID=UPI00248653AA|nr:RNA polymerase II-associated protein 3 [Episyrphus balteatus]
METVPNSSAVQVQRIINNAEEFKTTRNDLNSWVKEVKDKEHKLSVEKDPEHIKSPPIRSQIPKNEMIIPKTDENVITEKQQKIEADGDREERRNQADVFNDIGNKHVKLQEYRKAILQYTTAIDTYSEDPRYFTNRALCFLKLKRYNECIDDCNRAIELDKLNIKAYYRRMQANEFLNFNTQALKDCTTVLMIDSKNQDAKKSLQRINQRLKNTGAVPKGYPTNEPISFKEGPNFSPLRSNMVDILPVNKPSYARSKKQLKSIPIIDVVGPKDGKNYENSNIQISDEVIDKLFNGECGSYEEVKKTDTIIEKDCNKIPQEKIIRQTSKRDKLEAEIITSVTKDKPLPPAPTSTAQFYCNWKELSAEQKYQYLKSIQIPRLNKILGAGFDSETLTSLLTIFKEFYVRNNDDLCETLLELCKHNRLKILSLMLSEEDKAALSDALNYIKNKASADELDLINESFNLK